MLDAVAQFEKFENKVAPIEDAILQGKSEANEDIENFPIRINDKLIDLQGTVEGSDTAPTAQVYVVFEMLSQQLDVQLGKWSEVKTGELAAVRSLKR